MQVAMLVEIFFISIFYSAKTDLWDYCQTIIFKADL